jgi:hypothetical protein
VTLLEQLNKHQLFKENPVSLSRRLFDLTKFILVRETLPKLSVFPDIQYFNTFKYEYLRVIIQWSNFKLNINSD